MDNLKNLIESDTPTIVDFFATWCGPCTMMHPVLEELKKRMGDRVRIVKIDIDVEANRPLVQQYGIRSVPTIILFRGGREVWKNVGTTDLETLVRNIEKSDNP